ncbi:MAG: hypothetical protein ABIR54_06745 [Burkholderiaceae bacterium]|jgi:hypothetical protein
MNSDAAKAFALAALLATASLHAQEPERGALCRAFDGKGGALTLVNLVPRNPAGGAIDLNDVDIDADGAFDSIHLACTPASGTAPEHCKLTLNLAGGPVLNYEREHLGLVQAGPRVYVSGAQTVCRAHRLVSSAELAAVVKGRFVTRCGPIATAGAGC